VVAVVAAAVHPNYEPICAIRTALHRKWFVATLKLEKLNFNPLTRISMGRPGLDPGTLGLKGTFKLLLGVDLAACVD
jgi:hypothetical protein